MDEEACDICWGKGEGGWGGSVDEESLNDMCEVEGRGECMLTWSVAIILMENTTRNHTCGGGGGRWSMDEESRDTCWRKGEEGWGGSVDEEAHDDIYEVERGGCGGGLVDEKAHCDMCEGEGG
jgi:hypothetical protein